MSSEKFPSLGPNQEAEHMDPVENIDQDDLRSLVDEAEKILGSKELSIDGRNKLIDDLAKNYLGTKSSARKVGDLAGKIINEVYSRKARGLTPLPQTVRKTRRTVSSKQKLQVPLDLETPGAA